MNLYIKVFLDDMVNSIFPDANPCDQEEALVTSTILKERDHWIDLFMLLEYH